LILSALLDGEILEEYKKMDKTDFEYKQHKNASEFFCRFNGVEIGDKDPLEVFTDWGIMVDGIIFYTIYSPNFIKSEESLTDLMVDLSLKIWGYQDHKIFPGSSQSVTILHQKVIPGNHSLFIVFVRDCGGLFPTFFVIFGYFPFPE
jgi:hypothetical protein